MNNQKPYTIVGFGIAGASLAWHFFLRGIPFRIVSTESITSRVAAGMMNPIVFKRITKSWMIDIFLPYAEKFYSSVENQTGRTFLHKQNIRRVFATDQEPTSWELSRKQEDFSKYMDEANGPVEGIHSPHGSGIVNTIGSLDVSVFLNCSQIFFARKKNALSFEEATFNYNEISDDEPIIFCEGHELVNNPFFNYLPIKPAHGEVLIISCPGLKISEIINRGCFIQPLEKSLFRVGATFNWKVTAPVITNEGKEELIARLKEILQRDFEVIAQEAGIRATVPDRRPLVGQHPVRKNLFVFGGLGAKGVMTAPYLAENLVGHLADGKEILKEVDVARWRKRFGGG